jgi:hypothetical protein
METPNYCKFNYNLQFENNGDHDKLHIKWFIKIVGIQIQNSFNIIVSFWFIIDLMIFEMNNTYVILFLLQRIF